ncbi:MAG: ATP-binding cassette domain-containing protein [Actinomycetota bacterium]|nr:ATP-binding cassette domain-containing protein [Actinomycetota bacterium]
MTSGLELIECSIGYDSPLLQAELVVPQGDIVAILGPSGCGKSTLLASILGSVPLLSGQIHVAGVGVTSLPIHKRRVGMVFQDPLLFTHLTVGRNVIYGLRRAGMASNQARARASELLAWVGLEGYEDRSPLELSGGQAQRVALVRSLAPNPALLLLDEPYSALDTDLRARLAAEVAGLLREKGVTAIHVTHDESEARSITDTIYRIHDQTLGA